MITGPTLISWGFEPGPAFKQMLCRAAELSSKGCDDESIRLELALMVPAKPSVLHRREKGSWAEAIRPESEDDEANLAAVRLHMDELVKSPVIEAAAIMPDACPAGNALGTIPVGGAVISRAIHPAFHSSDICCSMHVSLWLPEVEPSHFLDAVQSSTRFGPGGRKPDQWVHDRIVDELTGVSNPFLRGLEGRAQAQLADQGDGNHFAYLGRLTVTPDLVRTLKDRGWFGLAYLIDGPRDLLALVTHHGSRALGAQVYKRGQEAAVRHTRQISPDTPAHQAWLDPKTGEGDLYWQALDYVRRWTRRNHELIHAQVGRRLNLRPVVSFGNVHNFVWNRGGLFYHGKGATPAWGEDGRPLLGVIPLNMASPILLTLGRDNERFCSFSPHGAGRNYSRTALLKRIGLHGLDPESYLARSRELLAEQTKGLDVRFWFDRPDISETPIAYKPAEVVRRQIDEFGLADVIAEIQPLGCIMAGDYDKPWMTRKAKAIDVQADAVEVNVE